MSAGCDRLLGLAHNARARNAHNAHAHATHSTRAADAVVAVAPRYTEAR